MRTFTKEEINEDGRLKFSAVRILFHLTFHEAPILFTQELGAANLYIMVVYGSWIVSQLFTVKINKMHESVREPYKRLTMEKFVASPLLISVSIIRGIFFMILLAHFMSLPRRVLIKNLNRWQLQAVVYSNLISLFFVNQNL